jgi:predicted RNA binding protein YcfA (HicA-like mRNA interferase family)
VRQKGSHVTFGKIGCPPVTIPKHDEKVKRTYLDDVCALLDLDAE